MIRQTVLDFGTDAALITAAFVVRNALVIIGLSVFAFIALIG